MKIGDIYKTRGFALSFEVFPPKTAQGLEPLYRVVGELCAFEPGFISCTYGAGGSTRDQTLEIVTTVRDRCKVSTTAHFTCVGSTVDELRAWLRRATELEVENIMALRGDPPQGETSFRAVEGGLSFASDLVRLVRTEFPHFGIGVAGYPETHQEAISPDEDLANLKRKVDNGGDAVFTQLFYDNDDFLRFRDRCRKAKIRVPIIPGLLPVLRFDQIQRITKLCKAKLPLRLSSRLEGCRDDVAAQCAIGVEHAVEQCEGLLKEGVDGIHFYILNKAEAAKAILETVKSHLPAKTG